MIRIRKIKVGPLKGLWSSWCNCTYPRKHNTTYNNFNESLNDSLEHLRNIGHI